MTDDTLTFTYDDFDEHGNPTGDKIEVGSEREIREAIRATGKPHVVAYAVDDSDAPMLVDDDGHTTRLDSAIPHPTRRKDQ